jgi:hypothetical protein
MSARLILVAGLLMAGPLAAPALAQDAPPAAAPAPAPEPMSPAEQAMKAKGDAFQARMQQMNGELERAMGDQTTDAAGKTAATNAIIDSYQTDIETFATDLETFLRAQAELPENAARKADFLSAAGSVPGTIRSIPTMIRDGIQQALTAPPPTAAPATPQ